MINFTSSNSQLNRREALRIAGASAALAVASSVGSLPAGAGAATMTADTNTRAATGFWPNGARLAVSISLMFEGGGQPISGAGGVIPDPIEQGVPDLPDKSAAVASGRWGISPRKRASVSERRRAVLVSTARS